MQTPDSELEGHLYLEEVMGEVAIEKVRAWNARTLLRLEANPLFEQMHAEALDIVNSKDRIPDVSYRKGMVHNFWQDAEQVRGVWRTATLESYLTDTPDWEDVLDIDVLAEAEEKNWVYKGHVTLSPCDELCLVCLSDGGKDAAIYREFDIRNKEFVEHGFVTKESKTSLCWLDKDQVLVGTDFGKDADGNSTMTDSGYPMIAKLWRRGTEIEDATEIGRGTKTDVRFSAFTLEVTDELREIVLIRWVGFYEQYYYWLPMIDGRAQEKVPVPVPPKCEIGNVFKGQVLVSLNEDWHGFKSGDLVSFSWSDFVENKRIDEVYLLYSPTTRASINDYGVTCSAVLISIFENITGSANALDWTGTKWVSIPLDFPASGSVSIEATHRKEDISFILTESFLTPPTLWKYESDTGKNQAVKSLPDWFDSSSMIAEQFETLSSDGTLIPYFVVRKRGLSMDSHNPTLLYGYGGFQISLNPAYSAMRGKLWIERGGVYVQANIRGGGEFGPAWHQAGLKTERQIIYDDFIAIAQELIDRGITSPAHLGIEGASNGGLLVGVMLTQRPDLFSAVVCAVPLLDMMRYHLLLAGASWMGEYGNPDNPQEGSFLKSISPYHNVQNDGKYPEVFFITSTKDDRVHPGHARKMAARFEDLGHEFLYYENIDGGHSAAANLKETARRVALQHTYLMEKLGQEFRGL